MLVLESGRYSSFCAQSAHCDTCETENVMDWTAGKLEARTILSGERQSALLPVGCCFPWATAHSDTHPKLLVASGTCSDSLQSST